MGLITDKPYRRLNRETGLFEWVYPEPTQYDQKDVLKPIKIVKPKRRKR